MIELVKSHFATHEVVVLTGFTKHMLDYLVREGIFRPSMDNGGTRGVRRRYKYEDVVLLKALHSICAGKGKIRHLKESLAALRREIGPISPGSRLDKLLFVQGSELCLRTDSEGGRQLRTGQLTLGFFVDLRAVTSQLAETIRLDRRTGVAKLTPEVAALAEAERQKIWAPIRASRGGS
jgi:MerR HTH family regulatory protein